MKALVVAAACAAGCAGQAVKHRTVTIDHLIETARENGAIKCAPVELAMAEAHNDFARHQLSLGEYFGARREADIAEKNAQLAVEKSPRDRCVDYGDLDGDGIKDNVDKCVRDPEDKDGFEDLDGCPDEDNDRDGIKDKVDKCPDDPEDLDQFQDEDGCPEPDNDGDGLADKIDKCPNEPEDKDGFDDDDGCPDCDDDQDGVPECPEAKDKCPGVKGDGPDGCKAYKMIVVTDKKIELKQTIYFDFRKASIKPISFPLLDEVAQALKDNSTIKVRIEGHTDSRGSDKFNLKLSKARSSSVRTYLLGKGIAPERMVAEGYGEAVPVADNRTAAGREQNRRVEFVITSR